MTDRDASSPYPIDPVSDNREGGIINMDYIKSIRGLLSFIVVGLLLLGFISAVSLPTNKAKLVDQCKLTKVKVSVKASNVAYLLFSFVTMVVFAALALLNSINVAFLTKVRDILSKMITVALVAFLLVLMFILSCTQAAAEHKLDKSKKLCNITVRAGGPGASSFFGFASILAMAAFAGMTFIE